MLLLVTCPFPLVNYWCCSRKYENAFFIINQGDFFNSFNLLLHLDYWPAWLVTMKETNKLLSGASASPLHASCDVAPLLLVSMVRKHFSFISHPQRQLLRTIETIGLLDVFETPGISLSKDLDKAR